GGRDDHRQPQDEAADHDPERHVLVDLELLVHVEGHHLADDPEADREDDEPDRRVHDGGQHTVPVHHHCQHHLPPCSPPTQIIVPFGPRCIPVALALSSPASGSQPLTQIPSAPANSSPPIHSLIPCPPSFPLHEVALVPTRAL